MNENKTNNRTDAPTGWMDTPWTEDDARWFEHTMQLRGQILQTDLGRPEHRDAVMERWGLDLSLLAGAGVDQDDSSARQPSDFWAARDLSKQWWLQYLANIRDEQRGDPSSLSNSANSDGTTSSSDGHNASLSSIDQLFQEAMYDQAVLIGQDREATGKARPDGLAADEWNDLVRLAGSHDEDDQRELRALAQTCSRRILFQNNRWPTIWSVFGWSDGPLFPWTVRRLIAQAKRQASLKNKMLEAAAPIQWKVVRAWQQRFQDHRNDREHQRDQGNRAWQAQIARKVCSSLEDDQWLAWPPHEVELKVRALNGWGHLMLGGGHDNWSGWVDGRRRGLWSEQQD